MSAEIVLTYIAYPNEGELERIRSAAAVGTPTPESIMFPLANIDGAEECLAFPLPELGFPRITPEVALAGLHDVVKAIRAEFTEPVADADIVVGIRLLELLMSTYTSGEVLVEEFC